MPTLYTFNLGWAITSDGQFATNHAGSVMASEGGADITVYGVDGNPTTLVTTSLGKIPTFKLEVPLAFVDFGAGARQIICDEALVNAIRIADLTAAAQQAAADTKAGQEIIQQAKDVIATQGLTADQVADLALQQITDPNTGLIPASKVDLTGVTTTPGGTTPATFTAVNDGLYQLS